jgi:type II secretory pathway pseudopilin PulG
MRSVKEWLEEEMGNIICWLVVIGFLLAVAGALYLENTDKTAIQERKDAEKLLIKSQTDNVVSNIRYIQDPRTNICYAYYWGGGAYGGPALTAVPCEKIPPELLVQTNPKN